MLDRLFLQLYVYQTITNAFLDHLLNSCNNFKVVQIGAIVYDSGASSCLIHDTSKIRISIQVSTNLESRKLLETSSRY